ncbi:MAG TPA: hypothetical protein GXX34_08325 [Clostridia bacterium]|nr:hypothetical protein [Clostridia bacterium]
MGEAVKTSLEKLQEKTEELINRMESLRLAEYVEMLHDPKRLWKVNFLAGLARGLGAAVGFTVLGAVVLYLLQRLVLLNLPLIGDFIAELVRLVMERY